MQLGSRDGKMPTNELFFEDAFFEDKPQEEEKVVFIRETLTVASEEAKG